MDGPKLKRLINDLKGRRQLHESVWQDCYRVTFPERMHGFLTDIVTAEEAQQYKGRIFDSTAGDSVRTGVATLMGAMVPSNSLWFGLDVGQESDEERAWLDDTATAIWDNLVVSNFDAEANDAMVDQFVAGWFVLYLDEAEGGGYYFEAWPVGECYISSTRSASKIDTVLRLYEMSVSQVVAAYGEGNVSEKTRSLYAEGKLDQRVRLAHVIMPRGSYKDGSKAAKEMPFASYHYECDGEHLIKEGGYHEFPCSVPRWTRIPGSAYATGPMSDALPDVMSLNEAKKWTLLGAEMTCTPPLVVTDDGVINPRSIKIGPRKVLVANEVDNIKPLQTGADVKLGFMTVESLQASVRKILMADHLPPQDGPTKTAYEWSVRVQTLRQMLGPMFGRFQAEFLQGMIERAFGILWRANEREGFRLIGKPPQSLVNRNFTVKFKSPLARAQRLAEVDAMDRFEMTLAQEMQVEPSVGDLYDWDGAARERGKALGLPHALVFDERTVSARRKAKNEQAQQAQQAQQQQALQANGQAEMQSAMAQKMAAQ